MLMHARSATVLAGPPALTRVPLDSLHLPSLPPLSPSLFVYLAKFDSPTRSDLTSRSLLIPLASLPFRARPPVTAVPSADISLSPCLPRSPLSSVSPSLSRVSLPPDRHRRWVFLSTPRSASPLVDSASESARRIRGSLFGGRRTTKNFFSTFFCHRAPPRNEAEFSCSASIDNL